MKYKIISPCLKCIRKNKDKNCYTCTICEPRSDFTLASNGNEDASKRLIAFKYQNIGKWITAPKYKAKKDFYEKYFSIYGDMINKRYNKNFITMKEIIEFLYNKYQNQTYISKNILKASRTLCYNMMTAYEIKAINRIDAIALALKRKEEGFPSDKD